MYPIHYTKQNKLRGGENRMLLTAGQIMGETVSAEGREQGFPSMWSGL